MVRMEMEDHVIEGANQLTNLPPPSFLPLHVRERQRERERESALPLLTLTFGTLITKHYPLQLGA